MKVATIELSQKEALALIYLLAGTVTPREAARDFLDGDSRPLGDRLLHMFDEDADRSTEAP